MKLYVCRHCNAVFAFNIYDVSKKRCFVCNRVPAFDLLDLDDGKQEAQEAMDEVTDDLWRYGNPEPEK